MAGVRIFGDAETMNGIEGSIPPSSDIQPTIVSVFPEPSKDVRWSSDRPDMAVGTVAKIVDREAIDGLLKERSGLVERLGVDVPLVPAAAGQGGPSWYLDGAPPLIGKRSQAVDHIRRLDGSVPDDCDDVGVVIFDVGVTEDYVLGLGGRFGGGWQMDVPNAQGSPHRVGGFADPHARIADGHGNMIARNVLSIAPSATIYDVPILPPRVSDVEAYASNVVPLLELTHAIVTGGEVPDWMVPPRHRHWILVNAWAVATSFADLPGPLAYRDRRDHPLNRCYIELATLPNVDVVFAAGNAGAHAPDPFAGAYDRGHHRAIWGANGLEEVWTVGAVDVGARPIAMSSPGPSLASLLAHSTSGATNLKPDISMPSWFAEDADASLSNTGTSAASGLAAGYLACASAGSATRPVPDGQHPAPSRWSDSAGYPWRGNALTS